MFEVNEGIIQVSYIIATILFILALGGLSNQETARRGNWYGIVGMAIALIATLLGDVTQNFGYLIVALLIGGTVGIVAARRVQMTQMPELVAILHSLVGLAAVAIIAIACHLQAMHGADMPPSRKRIRKANAVIMMAATFSLAYSFGLASPEGGAAAARDFTMSWMLSIGLLGLTVLAALLIGAYSLHLSKTVRVKFEGKRWAVPARLYARPLELYAGAPISAEQFDRRVVPAQMVGPREP